MKINEITPQSMNRRVAVGGKITVPLSEPRQTTYGPVRSLRIADDTGEIAVALWDTSKLAGGVAVGGELMISGKVSQFNRELCINVGQNDQCDYLPPAAPAPRPEAQAAALAAAPRAPEPEALSQDDTKLLIECGKLVLKLAELVGTDEKVRERLRKVVGAQ